MLIDKHGFFGFGAKSEVENSKLELVIDDLLRISKIMSENESENFFIEDWNNDDSDLACESWTNFWIGVSEFILENSTDSDFSIDSLFNTDEPFIFADILAQEFGVQFEILPGDANTPVVSYSIEEIRIHIEQRAYEIGEAADEPVVPELNISPEVSEVEFSGFIKGEPKAKWTIRNLLEDLESKKLVFPSWQRKSDAWSPAKKQNLIRSLLLRIPLPSIIIHERNDGTREVVDGRQRISALSEFFSNQFKTAKFDQNTVLNKVGALPADASGIEFFGDKYWQEMDGAKIRIDESRTKGIEDWMNEQIVPSLEFSGLTDEQLYYIFTVYNTNSTPLNAAEIRNAVYHDAPLHRALMREAGDLENEQGVAITPQNPDITLRYRTGVSPKKDPTRFAASEALMRACAFTLIRPKDDGKHKADSAAKAIQSTLIMSKEQNWSEEACSELANRILKSYQTMRDAFGRIGLDAINRPSGEKQTMRYNTVRATSMHSAFVILDQCRYQGLEISQQDFDNFVTLINSVEQDEKQSNTKTWNFHINVIYKSIQFVEEKGFSRDDFESSPYRNLIGAAILANE
jgi:hypothetical protein